MKPSLEQELLSSISITNKCRENAIYSQNLYAALCNNRFFKDENEWTCSWRYAGGILSDMNDGNDYMDWYCSGIWGGDGHISEGIVTDEIRSDLLNIGWTIRPYEPRLEPGTYRNEW
jgi:hypothetical protein